MWIFALLQPGQDADGNDSEMHSVQWQAGAPEADQTETVVAAAIKLDIAIAYRRREHHTGKCGFLT